MVAGATLVVVIINAEGYAMSSGHHRITDLVLRALVIASNLGANVNVIWCMEAA